MASAPHPIPAPVRVRFAPSPTGWLHVGGARTAYFNWLFARRHGGTLVLRIEDTDVERSSDASERGVLDDLLWLGLAWDEGPDVGGPFGPYRQSERVGLYRERAEALLARGLAYPCFCDDDDLERRRQQALSEGRPPHYDGRCRRLTGIERATRLRDGGPWSVRFAVPDHEVTLDDQVRGAVRFPPGMVGDFVVLRSNGLPTYNFACAVDDAAMRITHVIRAEEHLSNTARQLLLLEAMDEPRPAYAHVPLILNRDRSKMSKRDGEASVSVSDWRRAGYLPEALLAYLALLGFHPGDAREILSREELLECFAFERVGHSGSMFDPERLRWTNATLLHRMGGAELAHAAAGFLPAAARALPDATLAAWLETVRGNLATLADVAGELEPLLAERPAREEAATAALAPPAARALCAAAADALEGLAEWRAEVFKSALQSLGTRLGVSGRGLYQPVRAALTGRLHGPELPRLAEVLGRDRCVARLRAAATEDPSQGGHA